MQKLIIPAVLAINKKQLADKISQVEDLVEYIQIDYMDGKFVKQKTNFTAADLYNLNPVPKQELHLMVNNPEDIIEDWIGAGVEKFIIHAEAPIDWEKINEIYHENYIKLYLALNPNTPLNKIDEHKKILDGVTIMGVTPGRTGQKFNPKILGKIKSLRQKYPRMNIQVDGGLHLKPTNSIRQVLLSGANEIVVGSEVFISKDIPAKIEELYNYLESFDA